MDRHAWTEDAKSLFGSPVRVAVGHWVVAKQVRAPFYQLECTDAMRIHSFAPSQVRAALESFVERGMLQRVSAGSRVYYQPSTSPYWEVYFAIGEIMSLGKMSEPSVKHQQ